VLYATTSVNKFKIYTVGYRRWIPSGIQLGYRINEDKVIITIYYLTSVVVVSQHGQQEDAEEFLSCILNRLHDEIVAVMKSNDKGKSSTELLY